MVKKMTPAAWERMRAEAEKRGFLGWFTTEYGAEPPTDATPVRLPGHFTKTETLKRLRILAAAARAEYGQAKTAKAEIGINKRPLAILVPGADAWIADDDDVDGTLTLIDAADDAEFTKHGRVVHVYVTGPGEWGELEGVGVGWLGTPDHAPEWIG